jgi:hypothetical protein
LQSGVEVSLLAHLFPGHLGSLVLGLLALGLDAGGL